ncbi:hypothetical protein H310_13420 [Aphanomyces invadans]|uniref:Secreted protein n=1 Tax=Aphanomyces invadans TaxID=157072 RepID=A0A024TDN8_9STRA|nr:hypothetical protein H310_13420 [Aphanomyces invadans]ETV92173.1 hypothetical protein H310_13420 [Aphanomyces invadans]|eukprot:XP_008879137.1 hypothetical protein H310_13420 [Aphanomyces invadans]
MTSASPSCSGAVSVVLLWVTPLCVAMSSFAGCSQTSWAYPCLHPKSLCPWHSSKSSRLPCERSQIAIMVVVEAMESLEQRVLDSSVQPPATDALCLNQPSH